MRRLLWLLVVLVCTAHSVRAQQGLQAYVVTGTGAQARIVLTGSAIVLHQLTWNVTGTVSSCTVALDTSADGVSWSAGNAIAGQTCTSNGQSALSTSAVFNFVRVNTTAFSGAGYVVITWAGYVASPGGLPSGCTSPGTGQINCTNSLSTGSGASAAGATATGGFACVEAASTGWTPTAGQDYERCDSTLHNFAVSVNGVAETPKPVFSAVPAGSKCLQSSGVAGLIAEAAAACGSGGAPGGVVILTKVATYAGASGDFSSSSAAPSQVIFTLTATAQTYTLITPAPATGSCVIVENSLASAPFILGILTGGALTLDGVAYTTASSSLALGPGMSRWYCSDGTNYRSQPGYGVAQVTTANIGGTWFPMFPANENSGVTTGANVVQTFTFVLDRTTTISNITIDYLIGVAASTGDAGIYDSSGNRLTHVSAGFATTVVSGGQIKSAASPVVTLPPGTYTVGMCDSNGTVSYMGNVMNGQVALASAASGSLVGPGTAANACAAGVLPATTGAITIANVLNTVPIFLGTP